MKKCYLAGKVSGCDIFEVFTKFDHAERRMMTEGYSVVNPLGLCCRHWSWLRCMACCLVALFGCHAIYLLSDWHDSRGARIEVAVAVLLNKEIIIG